jgi:hypothetical protein
MGIGEMFILSLGVSCSLPLRTFGNVPVLWLLLSRDLNLGPLCLLQPQTVGLRLEGPLSYPEREKHHSGEPSMYPCGWSDTRKGHSRHVQKKKEWVRVTGVAGTRVGVKRKKKGTLKVSVFHNITKIRRKPGGHRRSSN